MAKQKTPARSYSRKHIHESLTLGERVADAVADGMGSWRFIMIQTVVVVLWITINSIGFLFHWDIYPFILLNLLFSTQAAYTGPILQMTSNRAAARDRKRDDHEAQEVEELFKIQIEQVKILNQQTEILNLLRDQKGQIDGTRRAPDTREPAAVSTTARASASTGTRA